MPFVIDDLLAGAAASKIFSDGADSVRHFLRLPPTQRMYRLLWHDFGDMAHMSKDEFYAFGTDSELSQLTRGLIDGTRLPSDGTRDLIADRIRPRLHRLPEDRRGAIAHEMAGLLIRGYPLATKDLTAQLAHVTSKLDAQHRESMKLVAELHAEVRGVVHRGQPDSPHLGAVDPQAYVDRLGNARPVTHSDCARLGVRPNVAGMIDRPPDYDHHGAWRETYPPFVTRSFESQMHEFITRAVDGDRRLVVLNGPPASGKTRAIVEHLASAWSSTTVYAPATPDDLPGALAQAAKYIAKQSELHGVADPVVVLLEDLEEFTLYGQLRPGYVQELPAGLVVLATAGGKGLSLHGVPTVGVMVPPVGATLARSVPSPEYYDILDNALVLEVEPLLDDDEIATAIDLYGSEAVLRFCADGPGPYFVAARRLLAHYRQVPEYVRAIYDALITWRHWLGNPSGIRDPHLRLLWRAQEVREGHSEEVFRRAVSQAVTPVPFVDVFLSWWQQDGLNVNDVLARNVEVPRPGNEVISAILETATADEAFAIGAATFPRLRDDLSNLLERVEQGSELDMREKSPDHEVLVTAFRRAADLGHGTAALQLAMLLTMLEPIRDVAASCAFFVRAIELGEDDAARMLGWTLWKEAEVQDLEAAVSWLTYSVEHGEPEATREIGMILRDELHDDDRAIAAYERGIELGDATSGLDLGMLLADRGEAEDFERARWAFERAVAGGSADAAMALGYQLSLRVDLRDLAGAASAFRRAMELGEARGATCLGLLLVNEPELRDIPEAILVFERGVELGEGEAALQLGRIFALQEDFADSARAISAFRQALELGSVEAADDLGWFLHGEGQVTDAIAAFEAGVELKSPEAANDLALVVLTDQPLRAIRALHLPLGLDSAEASETLGLLMRFLGFTPESRKVPRGEILVDTIGELDIWSPNEAPDEVVLLLPSGADACAHRPGCAEIASPHPHEAADVEGVWASDLPTLVAWCDTNRVSRPGTCLSCRPEDGWPPLRSAGELAH